MYSSWCFYFLKNILRVVSYATIISIGLFKQDLPKLDKIKSKLLKTLQS